MENKDIDKIYVVLVFIATVLVLILFSIFITGGIVREVLEVVK